MCDPETRARSGRRGGMLIAVVLAMALAGILGGAAVSVFQTSGRREMQHHAGERAYYVAIGGVAYARTHSMSVFSEAVFSLGGGDTFVLTLTNDSTFAYAHVVGRSGVGTPWEAHYRHPLAVIELETGEQLGVTLADDFDQLELVGTDEQAAWAFPEDQLEEPDEDRLFTTSLEVETEQGWRSANYLTFQNFTEVLRDQGFVANLVPSAHIAPSARNADLYGIWGNASDNIYVVGQDGIILHFDGTTQNGVLWHRMTSPTAQVLRDIWGIPSVAQAGTPDRMIAVGNSGEIVEFEGGAWRRITNPRDNWVPGFRLGDPFSVFDLYGIYGTDWNNMTTYGDYGASPYKWSGRNPWVRYMGGTIPPGNNWRDWASRNDVDSSAIWRPYDYYDWRYRMFRGNWELRTPRDRYVFSVGHDRQYDLGFIFNEVGAGYYIRVNGLHTANAVWGISLDDAYVAGRTSGGAGAILHSSNALRWNRWNWQAIPSVPGLNGIYGGASDYIFAGGDAGTLLFYDGEAWTPVKGQDGQNVTPRNVNAVWGTEQTGLYAVGDNGTIVYLGYPANTIGGYMLPIHNNAQFAAHWGMNNRFLSYTIQSKIVWGDDLAHAAGGFNFRWRLAPGTTNRYEGYGISFMRYAPSAGGINDLIPNSIKPAFQGTQEKGNRLLVVLWDQTVADGNEQRQWLAYKDITDDTRVARPDGHLRDLSTLMVRVEETLERKNRVTVYYGNASASAQTADAMYHNTLRRQYNPSFATPAGSISWPPFDVSDWTEARDDVTVVADVSVAEDPQPGNFWIVNPVVSETRVMHATHPETAGHEIILSAFHSPTESPFGTQASRPEVGLHVFGDIGDHGTQALLSFAEFRMQLGVDR